MNIKQLRYFIKICETGSFSRAAEHLYISQQGLSMAIMRLEQELSCTLFERTPGGLRLTQDSEYLLPRAMEIVKNTEECESHFQQLYRKGSSLMLCGTPSAFIEYAGDLLFGFQEENPQHKIKIRECSDVMCDTAIETSQAELAFTTGPVDDQKFDSQLMLTRPLHLLVRSDHPLAQCASVKLDALRTVPLTIMCDGIKVHSEIVRCCESEGFTPEVQHMAVTVTFAVRAAAGGAVVLILRPDIYEKGLAGSLKAVPIRDRRVRWTSYMIKKRGSSLSSAAQELEQYIMLNKSISKGDILYGHD